MIEDETRIGRLALELGRALQRANRNPESIDVLRWARDMVPDDADMEQSLAAEVIGSAWWDPEDLPLAERELAKARKLELSDGYGGNLLRAILSYAEARVGDDREYALRLAETAIASGHLSSTGSRALYSLGYTFTVAGRTDATIDLYDRAYIEALRRGDYVLASGCALFRSLAYLHEGKLAAAEEDIARVTGHAELQMALPYHAAFAGWIALERGDLDEAERLLGRAGLPERISRSGQFLLFRLVRGRLRFEQRRLDEALEDVFGVRDLSIALGHRNPAFMPWQPYAALMLNVAGRTEEAREIALAAVERARIWGARDARRHAADARPRRRRPGRRAAPGGGGRRARRLQRAARARKGARRTRCRAPPGQPALRFARPPPRGARPRARIGAKALEERARTELRGNRRPPAPPAAHRTRVADPERAPGCRDGGRKPDEQGHRPGALRDAEDGRGTPFERVPQARDLLQGAAFRGARRR